MVKARGFIQQCSLEAWLTACIVGLSLVLLGGLATTSHFLLASVIEEKTGQQALAIARTLASRPDIKHAVETEQMPISLSQELTKLSKDLNASYIVIGNEHRVRLYHPQQNKIGQIMQGGDSLPALNGQYYVSSSVGSLGPSIRGKAPVFNDQQDIVGLVSVGVMEKSVSQSVFHQSGLLLTVMIVVLTLATIVARFISQQLRSKLGGLQPAEINRLYAQQNAIFNTFDTGIVALSVDGKIQRINRRAAELLDSGVQASDRLHQLLPQHSDFLLSNIEQPLHSIELYAGQQRLIMSRVPLDIQGHTTGLLLTLRPADEVEYLSEKLARVEAFAELLRVQTHDYSNKLNMLNALLHMGHNDKALALINRENQVIQSHIHQLLGRVNAPVIAALLFGKSQKAQEAGVNFVISPETHLSNLDEPAMTDSLVSIFGNLIDNAIEAARNKSQERPPEVRISLEESGKNIVFDVDDSGDGIPVANYDSVFAPGYSSKSEAGHGIGLYLVKTHLASCQGSIEIDESDLGGVRFSVYIPKR